MPASASVTVETLRSAQRELSRGPVMPRLWHALRGEWQRMIDRTAAQSVRKLDHAGDVRQASLTVIGEQHRVVPGNDLAKVGEHGSQDLMIGLILEVNPDELLCATDDSQLYAGI